MNGLENLIFSLDATLPVFLVMVAGGILGKLGFLPKEFCKAADKLTFKITLPVMLFLDMAEVDMVHDFEPKFVLFCAGATLVSILVIWFVVVALVLGFVLSRTVYGQQLYAIGANPTAARYSGIRFKRNITVAYLITGLCVGLAALIMMSNALSSNPQSASGAEMEIILCVVLGGCAVQGGKGSVWGTIIGVLFYGILSAGFTSLHMSQYLQWVVMGAIMLFALSLDVLKGKGVKLWKRK